MRFPRKNSQAGTHCCAALAAVLLLACSALPAADEDPEAPWAEVMAWASVDPFAPKPEVKPEAPPPADQKRPPSIEMKSRGPEIKAEKRTDPKEFQDLRTVWLKKAEPIRSRAENNRDYELAWDYSCRMDDFARAANNLTAMQNDPRKYKDKLADGRWEARLCEAGMMLPEFAERKSVILNVFKRWEEKRQQIPNADPNVTKDFEELWSLFYKDPEWMKKLENDGNPESLWSVCERFGWQRPRAPLHCVLDLMRLRAWYPDYERVRNGEVQWRLVQILNDDWQLPLPKECADEALKMCDLHPQHQEVREGNALWLAGEARLRQHYETRSKEAAAQAREIFESFKKEYPRHSHNQGEKGKRTDCDQKIEEAASRCR